MWLKDNVRDCFKGYVEQQRRIERLEAALRGIINHWHEFGHEHGMAERIDGAEQLLK